MLALVGMIVVLGAVLGGFAMANGPFPVLVQPSEFVVILGSAMGTLLLGAPPFVIKGILKSVPAIFKGSKYPKAVYLDLLVMLYKLFVKMRRDGLIAIEADVNQPESSEVFKAHPKFLADHHAVEFLCDTLKLMVAGMSDPFELDKAMDAELETHHHEAGMVPAVITRVGDAMPGLGIVAAVLGIIITMQHIDGPPQEIGHHVAAALVGTFLGILVSYGFFQPIAAAIEHQAQEEGKFYVCMKAGLVAAAAGTNPVIAVEMARRTVFSYCRPSAAELDEALKAAKK